MEEDVKAPGKLFVPSLIIAIFAVSLSVPMLSIVTVDIARTFLGESAISLATAAQVNSINKIAEVAFAIVMGFITVKFRSKPLLLVGAVFLLISAIGGYYSPTIEILQFFYILEGGGTVIVSITAYSLVGELLASRQKAKVVSYLNAVSFAALVIAAPAISLITNFGGWRLNYIWLVIPLSISGLVLSYIAMPSKAQQQHSSNSYFSGFKEVFKNKSAVACLFAGMCGAAGNFSILATAFYRQTFLTNTPVADQVSFASLYFMAAAIIGVVSSLLTGRLISRFGAILLATIGAAGNSIFALVFFLMPNLPIALSVDMVHIWFFGMAVTPWAYLALDQTPTFRGTMMSLRSIFLSIGAALTTVVGGAALVLFGSYQAVGVALALTILPCAPLIYFLTKDPNRNQPS